MSALMVMTACSTHNRAAQAALERLSAVDVARWIINPDMLMEHELLYDGDDKPVGDTVYRWQRPDALGFIGDFDRFRIRFFNEKKLDDRMYSVVGVWSWYGDEGLLKSFTGTIHLDSVVLCPERDIEDEYNAMLRSTESGKLYATVVLMDEYGNSWKGRAEYEYDVIDWVYQYSTCGVADDGYCNNQYTGVMTTPEGDLVCNWGDFRIPGSGNHDTGCGVFVPHGGRGWEYYDMIDMDSLLAARDREWTEMHNVSWKYLDWPYEKVLEHCSMNIAAGKELRCEDVLALMPQSRNQFWQFWDETAHAVVIDDELLCRRCNLHEFVIGRMLEGDFEIMERFLPACWQWSDGGVADVMWDIDYQLWKKYPREIESIARKHDCWEVLREEVETMEEWKKGN